MSYKVMKALTVNVGPGLVDCDNANSNLNERVQGEVETFPTGSVGEERVMSNCGCRVRVGRRL
jgi:hypothetical protein